MLAIDKTVGSAYTSDAEYYEFFGAQYSQIIYDWTRRVWVRCLMQAPKTPRDKVTVADPELAIADEEPWEEAQPVVPVKPFKPQARTAKLLAAIFEQLQERPLSTRELADANGVSRNQIALLIQRYNDSFEQLSQSSHGAIYGIKGQQYTRVYTKSMPRVLDYLRAHGPSSAKAICEGIGITQQTLNNADNDNVGVLTVVGVVEKKGVGKRSPIYGIVGIHDTQKDAA